MPTILIAEDESAIAQTVLYALRAEGWQAEHVLLGGEVLPRLRQGGIDLIILDVGLPDANGFETMQPVYPTTVGHLADAIEGFKTNRDTLMIDRVGTGLTRALYATYVSYLPVERFSYTVPQHADPVGQLRGGSITPDDLDRRPEAVDQHDVARTTAGCFQTDRAGTCVQIEQPDARQLLIGRCPAAPGPGRQRREERLPHAVGRGTRALPRWHSQRIAASRAGDDPGHRASLSITTRHPADSTMCTGRLNHLPLSEHPGGRSL